MQLPRTGETEKKRREICISIRWWWFQPACCLLSVKCVRGSCTRGQRLWKKRTSFCSSSRRNYTWLFLSHFWPYWIRAASGLLISVGGKCHKCHSPVAAICLFFFYPRYATNSTKRYFFFSSSGSWRIDKKALKWQQALISGSTLRTSLWHFGLDRFIC